MKKCLYEGNLTYFKSGWIKHLRYFQMLHQDGILQGRSSRPEMFCKKGILRNLTKFTGKHLCQSLFFRLVTLLKKRLWHSCFPVNFVKFLRTPFCIGHLWQLPGGRSYPFGLLQLLLLLLFNLLTANVPIIQKPVS